MTIKAQTLLDGIRREVNDANAAKWQDEDLLSWANYAIREYSRYFPRTAQTTIAAANASSFGTIYALPQLQSITRVEYQVGSVIRVLMEKERHAGDIGRTDDALPAVGSNSRILFRPVRTLHYRLSTDPDREDAVDAGPLLHLDFQPDTTGVLVIDYEVPHTEFNVNNPSSTTTVPATEEELLALYAQAKAWALVSGKDANLMRFAEVDEQGRRSDSPILPKEMRLFSAYRRRLQELLDRPRTSRLRRRR